VLIEDAVRKACIWEVTARKVGNVHPRSADAGTTLADFARSAEAIAPIFRDAPHRSVGSVIYDAIAATAAAVGQNTNLGIVLLLAPLACAETLDELPRVLSELTVEDAERAYAAIRQANPGGLGSASKEDVQSQPTVTLLEAMRLAANRDLIAKQYAAGFADVLAFGVPTLEYGFEQYGSVEAAIIETQLCWLAAFLDSLIARKNGIAVAEDVRERASQVQYLGGIAAPEGRQAGIAFDRFLRSDGNKLNPGTTADLIAASLFVALRENKLTPDMPFDWTTDEWL
jgi:triphosphoribosyl-dephospho-CoA synthase